AVRREPGGGAVPARATLCPGRAPPLGRRPPPRDRPRPGSGILRGGTAGRGLTAPAPDSSSTSGVRLGTQGWSYPDWVGTFYPPGARQRSEEHTSELPS